MVMMNITQQYQQYHMKFNPTSQTMKNEALALLIDKSMDEKISRSF